MAGKNVVKEELAKKAENIKNTNAGSESACLVPAGDNGSGMFVRLLRAEEIECRVSVINEKGLSLLLFKDARVDQKILDETFTPFGWRRTHQSIDGNLYCTVEIWDREKGQWIAKQDVGTVSYSEKEKGQASDSFKRACFNWGLGRELYTAPFIWIPADKVSIKPKDNKFTTSERFYVHSIAYNEQREITHLAIVNGKGRNVFETGRDRQESESNVGAKSDRNTNTATIYRTDVNGEQRMNAITEIQRTALEKELRRTGVQMEAVLARYNIQNLSDMTEEIYTKALNSLKKTATKAA